MREKLEEAQKIEENEKSKQENKLDFRKRKTWQKFKRKKIFIKRNKSLPNMKKLIDMTEKSTPKYKYLQWKDQTYFKYIKRLLKIAIDQKVNEKE